MMRRRWKEWTPSEDRKLIEMVDRGYSITYIAKKLRRGKWSIFARVKQLKIPLKYKKEGLYFIHPSGVEVIYDLKESKMVVRAGGNIREYRIGSEFDISELTKFYTILGFSVE